ncbi:MAG: chemotaxis response regulator protein-glutamate methylesterase [Melioribacteraceae bacterium]|nr:chemotaxis response regulator protein-glutamate methylesterase [Melioribacteraceae bacterium]MCF8353741.1 chemotaxis response regulator protein-glutamate methylesterase [Melioribacteraceae bacterium]MCF8392450.1 chemotaxis response regulator protein-glutamate methylesterase [Melioribacteraceae bacterium]MCF8418361.1 chemotaxis response regulator protein-glutamate methylesterase [Melioribacteraceae bacterium]
MEKIKVAIVDDSAFMRKSLSIILGADPEIEIIGTARDGVDGIELIKKTKPDVVTLDIEMPRMDGLSALKIIMKECPTSVIMVSSLTTEGAEATMEALELGAVDFIPKEMSYVSVKIVDIKEELIRKIKSIAKHHALKNRLLRIQSRLHSPQDSAPKIPAYRTNNIPKAGFKAITIGISTGGPISLQKVIPMLSGDIKIPIFLVQHMPPTFTKSLADRLNNLSSIKVKEAEHNEVVKGGTVYVAHGGQHMLIYKSTKGNVCIKLSEYPANTLHKPSVDVMMNSVLDIYGRQTLGVIMTGMGKDGFEGIKRLKALGGYTIAQDELSCVVYGMPKAIVDKGLADSISPLEKIPKLINNAV